MTILITDADDPRIAAYRNVRERDLVGRDGQFIAEGEVVLRHLLTSRLVRPVSVLIARSRAERMSDLLPQVPAGVPIYLAEQAVLDAIAGFPLHRGILAIGEAVARPTMGELLGGLPERALVVGLYGIGNHDNMGGLFRNAAAFGAHGILLAADCCDPFYRKAIRVSVGASLITPFAKLGEGQDMVAALVEAGFEVMALSPSGELPLAQLTRSDRSAALFGSEGPGLPDGVLSQATTVRIPMAQGFDSLNVATSSGIVLNRLTEL